MITIALISPLKHQSGSLYVFVIRRLLSNAKLSKWPIRDTGNMHGMIYDVQNIFIVRIRLTHELK
jgi:hypothetical protein